MATMEEPREVHANTKRQNIEQGSVLDQIIKIMAVTGYANRVASTFIADSHTHFRQSGRESRTRSNPETQTDDLAEVKGEITAISLKDFTVSLGRIRGDREGLVNQCKDVV